MACQSGLRAGQPRRPFWVRGREDVVHVTNSDWKTGCYTAIKERPRPTAPQRMTKVIQNELHHSEIGYQRERRRTHSALAAAVYINTSVPTAMECRMTGPSLDSAARARQSTWPIDKYSVIPILACGYASIGFPLILSTCSPTDAACLLETRPENKIFWPLMAAVSIMLAALNS